MKKMLPILRERISAKLIILIILCSSVVTFVITAAQIYIDYHSEIDQLETRINQINSSFNQSISSGVWNISNEQIQNALEGINKLPDIVHLMVQSEHLSYQNGTPPQGDFIQKDFSLIFSHEAKVYNIGKLTITAELEGIYSRLINKLLFVLLSQSLKTFLVSFFMFIIFDRLIVRHLQAIVTYMKKADLSDEGQRLKLSRNKKGRFFKFFQSNDELDYMAAAINRTLKYLHNIYNKLRESNDNLESVVKKRTHELQIKNKELELYDYSVAHDLKNPISSIKAYAEILEGKLKKHETSSSLIMPVERIHKASCKSLDIIEELLNFAKSGGKIENMEITPIVDLTKIAREQLASIIEQKNGEITHELNVQSILCNKTILGQIFTNIISNSLKYCPSSKKPEIKIISNMSEDNSEIEIAFVDNSIGIPKEKLNVIFDEHVRLLDKEVDENGHGIGLASVLRLVESNNGKITVDSEYGEGTTFTLHFPSSPVMLSSKTREIAEEPVEEIQTGEFDEQTISTERIKVLLIDDDFDIQNIVKIFLDSSKYDLYCVSTGEKGIEEFYSRPFDIVMVDLNLPGMPGKEAIKRLKSIQKNQVRIVAFSAQSRKEEILECFSLGCDFYLQKPFDKKSLNKFIEKVLA